MSRENQFGKYKQQFLNYHKTQLLGRDGWQTIILKRLFRFAFISPSKIILLPIEAGSGHVVASCGILHIRKKDMNILITFKKSV